MCHFEDWVCEMEANNDTLFKVAVPTEEANSKAL